MAPHPGTLRDVDSAELERLEFELAAAQTVLQDANLEEQFARLTTANSQVRTRLFPIYHLWVNGNIIDMTERVL